MHPLTTGQRGIWFAQSLDPDSAYYNIAQYIDIHCAIDPNKFAEAMRRTVSEIPALRSVFLNAAEGPKQCFRTEVNWQMPFIDLTGVHDPHHTAVEWMQNDRDRVFDLERGPLFRNVLFKITEHKFYWYQVNHHLINDAFGAALVDRCVAAHYRQLVGGAAPETEQLLSCVTRLAEDEAYVASTRYERDRRYWREQLADRPAAITLSGRPPCRPGAVFEARQRIPGPAVEVLRKLGSANHASLAAAIIAVTAAYLSRMTGACDMIVGMPVSGRINPGLRGVAGLVSNIVPLRVSIERGTALVEVPRRTGRKIREALRHQRY